MKIKAVLFDLDGTLLDTLDDIADSANYSLARLGFPAHDVDAYRYFVGSGADSLLKAVLPEDARTADTLAELKAIYIERYGAHSLDKTRPYAGVEGMLKELKKYPLKLAVISNKPDSSTKFTVSRSFGEGVFDVVAGGREGVPLKPDPAIANIVLGEFGISGGEAVLAGDTSVDLATAKNAGCVSVGVTWGFRPKEAETGADYVISDPSELPPLILSHS
ncbi:MAG: HAD hydrolase-like protein [Synergistaceae bacterium]|jgi:phosphoglycolate phosphatase|nr:HAD hydrolase-like protein [Synergistaceae bacterium]